MQRGRMSSVVSVVSGLLCVLMTVPDPSSASAVGVTPWDSSLHGLTSSVHPDYPSGDPRPCLQLTRENGYKMQTFEVLPGYGWDNLRNVAEGQVVSFNYSQCRSTEDGRFLLPDSVSAVPVKTSNVHTFAELMTHWKNWTSTTSKSINVDAGLPFTFSGKFSSDFEDVKSKEIGDKAVTIRAQARFIRYGVQLQPETPLHPVFKARVLEIAEAEVEGQRERARYLAQLLVRDFGTHIVTKADAGASLEQVDQVLEEWVRSEMKEKSRLLAAASASFFSIFHMSASYETKADKEFVDTYKKQRTSSKILTKGGPVFRPGNFTPDSWAAEVDRDLVAMDRSGDPLFYVLTGATLPELPASTLNEVHERVKEAVETYYSYNAIPGCLDPRSPNFSPIANTDDGSCKPPVTNLTFGGVFQNCSMNPKQSSDGDLCRKLSQVNPLTGGYSCPDRYRAIKLHSGTTAKSRSEHRCVSYWIFWKKCSDVYYRSEATYTTFWCVASGGGVPPHSGYLFGGLFTSQVVNPVTQASTCPPAFFPLSIGSDAHLHICISDDYDLGEEYALPFAGFMSCEAGNPLAVAGNGTKTGAGGGPQVSGLRAFFKDQSDQWPKRCPDGFSQHLATVDKGCQINYCVQTGSMAGPVLPPIKRPPFTATPPVPPPPARNLVLFDPVTHTWKRNAGALKMLAEHPQDSSPDPDGFGDGGGDADGHSQAMSAGTAAGIAVGATLGCGLLALLVFKVWAKRRRLRDPNLDLPGGINSLENPLLQPQRGPPACYGGFSATTTTTTTASRPPPAAAPSVSFSGAGFH